jgi:hypothetical protein
MRFEIRVRNHGQLWELRAGAYGRAHFFRSRACALAHARVTARLAWEDRRIPASVSVLLPDGVWQLDASYGDEPVTAAPRAWLAEPGEA